MPTFSAFFDSDGYWSSSGTFDTTATDFVAGYNGTTFGAFFRRSNVTIPAGAIVSAATISVTKNAGTGTCDIRVALEAADNPAFPTSKADAEGRTITSSYAHINTAPSNGAYTTPDMSGSCQEVFDRGGWNSGQAVQAHWRNFKATPTGIFQGRCIERTGTSEDPSISITYSVPTVYTETGSGGVAVGGTAAALLAVALTAAGGVALIGTAAAAQATSDVGQGGVAIDGEAEVGLVMAQIASGGVSLEGSAPNVATFADVAQGGVVIGGSAFAGLLFSEVASGGVALSGAADLVSFASFVGSGGVSIGGEGLVGQMMAITGAGGVVIGGSAAAAASAVESGTGGVLLGGSAAANVTLAELAAGGVFVGGEASISVYSPSAGAGGSFICDACNVFRPGSRVWNLFAGGAVVVGQFVPGERAHQVGGCQCTT